MITTATMPSVNRNQVLSRDEIEDMIANGHVIVIIDGRVLQLDQWIENHPGGKLAMLHMVGHDASNEVAM
jgi:delta8-fatty-acid desaturase